MCSILFYISIPYFWMIYRNILCSRNTIVLNSFSPQNTERRQHYLRMKVFVPISSENQIHVLSLMLNHQNMDLTYCITYSYSLRILCHKYFYTFYIDPVACTLTLQRERETVEMIKRVDFITDDHYLQRNHNPFRFTLADFVPLKKEESATNWERRKKSRSDAECAFAKQSPEARADKVGPSPATCFVQSYGIWLLLTCRKADLVY